MQRLSRRTFIHWGAAGATILSVPACGYYGSESGVAFEPWELDESGEPAFVAVRAAILAASPHNIQPWRFEVTEDRIELFEDRSKDLGAMDSLQREKHIGLGCAIENLVVAASHHGRRARVMLMPSADESHVATIELTSAAATDSPLYFVITERHTNRGPYLDGPAPAGLNDALASQIEEASVRLKVLDAPADKARFREATIEATRAIIDDVEMNEASHAWYRHTKDEIERFRDGTTLDATGNGSTLRFFGKVTGRPSADSAGGYWLRATEGAQTTGSAFVILSSEDRSSRVQQLEVGRAFQRIHLWATSEGLALQPLNQLVERQDREITAGLSPRFTEMLSGLVGEPSRAQMLFRIGYAFEEAKRSPRRPLDWVVRS